MQGVTRPEPEADEEDTRTRLLRAGAHLFARKGVDAVRIREIHAMAGQLNESAVHYHFGGRWGLIRAILEENDLAAAQLLGGGSESASAEGIVRYLVARLAMGLRTAEGRDWIRIVVQLMGRSADAEWDRRPEVAQHLRSALPSMSPDVIERRVVAMLQFMTYQVAERARRIDDGEGIDQGTAEEKEFLDDLAAMSLGLLTAPSTLGCKQASRE